jgi:hypothetical protein
MYICVCEWHYCSSNVFIAVLFSCLHFAAYICSNVSYTALVWADAWLLVHLYWTTVSLFYVPCSYYVVVWVSSLFHVACLHIRVNWHSNLISFELNFCLLRVLDEASLDLWSCFISFDGVHWYNLHWPSCAYADYVGVGLCLLTCELVFDHLLVADHSFVTCP